MQWLPESRWGRRLTVGSLVLLVPAMMLSNHMERKLDRRIEERDRAEEERVRQEEEERIRNFLAAQDKDGSTSQMLQELRKNEERVTS